jgi:hypothetical protein
MNRYPLPESILKTFRLFVLILIALCGPLACCAGINSLYPLAGDSLNIPEKVYLHIDRDSYYPGDDIWFKAYLVDASERLLASHSNNLHVELISPALKIIDSRIIRLHDGLGNGDFHLAEKLQSGRYIIRAYTNYMRNFSDQLFFSKDITIINSTDAVKAFSESTKDKINKPEISFFPEGGSLVDNVASLVAFKAVNDDGYGYDVSGEIYSSAGNKVCDFKSTHLGKGTFLLDPAPGLKYFAIIVNKYGDLTRYELPKSFSTGVVLSVSQKQDGKMSLTFKTNPETQALLMDRELSLTVSAHNIAFKSYSFRMNSLNSFLKIPSDDLPEGIVMLTLSGLNNIPLCERLVFVQNDEEAKVKVKVETDRKEYNLRDSLSLKVSFCDSSGKAKTAFLSLSATDNIFKDNSSGFPSTISSWFLLESDIRGPVEDPSYYFDPSNANRFKDLDLLLLTQGWRDFEWKYKKMNYPPENGFTISGRVRKKFADIPVKNAVVNIGIFDIVKPFIKVVPTDSTGRFCLNGVDLTGDAKLIASITGDNDKLRGWLLLDSSRYTPATVKPIIAQTKSSHNNDRLESDDQLTNEDHIIKEKLHTFIQYAEFKKSVQKKYRLSDTIKPGEVTITAKREDAPESARSRSRHYLMGTPDEELVITPELQHYSSVYQLVDFRFIRQGKLPKVPGLRLPGIRHPQYLVDGVKVDADEVKHIPVSAVERIDVLDNIASFGVFGSMVFGEDLRDSTNVKPLDGVISIILKDDFDAGYTSVFHSVNVKFSGYNEPRIFYAPKHHSTLLSDYKPDLRTTLFWEPDIKMENNKDLFLNYYNTDNPAKVKVIVEGITTNGIPITGETEYEVK